ncbi:MAG: hypothetical protein MHPSP_001232 [Paramarteilia canceri]
MVSTVVDSGARRHEEYQYLDSIKDLIENGSRHENRTGIPTLAKFGTMMRYSLENNTLPLFTTKQTAYKAILKELLFFIRGDTNNKHLQEQNVHIWDGNSTREFLDNRNLHNYEEGDLGPIYGFQWRHFGADYKTCNDDYSGQGIDQLMDVIEKIRKEPTDRRLIVSAWNPQATSKMALPPCHLMFQFHVDGDQLDCIMYQRSCDMALGVPFNVASYSILTHIVAFLSGLKARHFIHSLGDYHVYENHVEPLKTQLEREPKPFPQLKIKDRGQKRPEDFVFEDFELENYEFWPRIKMDMAV